MQQCKIRVGRILLRNVMRASRKGRLAPNSLTQSLLDYARFCAPGASSFGSYNTHSNKRRGSGDQYHGLYDMTIMDRRLATGPWLHGLREQATSATAGTAKSTRPPKPPITFKPSDKPSEQLTPDPADASRCFASQQNKLLYDPALLGTSKRENLQTNRRQRRWR